MSKRTVLITGAGGFTGKYVVDAFARANYEVIAWSHDGSANGPVCVDLCDAGLVKSTLKQCEPDVVVHLAAISFVAHGNAEEMYAVNLLGTRNLLEGLSDMRKRPTRVVLASSANVYGNTEGRISESSSLSPQNDYAVSKLAMEYMAKLWSDRLPISIVRPFNYSGVGQSEKFLIPKIISHFKQRKPVIELGNMDVTRDFNDVRRVASAYERLISGDAPWEIVNVCSGREYSLRQIISIMEEIAGYTIETVVNPQFVRANEVSRLVGDPDLLVRRTAQPLDFSMRELLLWMYRA